MDRIVTQVNYDMESTPVTATVTYSDGQVRMYTEQPDLVALQRTLAEQSGAVTA